MTTEFERNIERFESASAELREAVRDAHSARKDLLVVIKECRAVQAEMRALIDEQAGAIVKQELDELGPKMRDWSNSIYDRVMSESQKLMNMTIFGNPEGTGDESIFDMLEGRVTRTIGHLDDIDQAALEVAKNKHQGLRLARTPDPIRPKDRLPTDNPKEG